MAIIHRKLFPATNQTVNCQDNCDPTCPYGCYPYPDYFFFPPPPPVMAESSKSHSGINLSPYAIVLITFTATFFLIIGYYAIFMRRCLRPRSSTSSNVGEEFVDENHRGPMIDNPIWYITTIGLQPSIINSITVFNYSKTSGLIDGTDCTVCLNEFQEDETLRLLPKCSHAFHIMCIDTWLRSHTNCPLCRCGILSNTPHTELIDNNSSSDLGLNQVTETEIQQHGEDLVVDQTQEQNEQCEIDGGTKGNEFWVVGIDEDNGTDDDMQIHRMNKSFSVNSPSSILHLGVECEGSSSNSRLYKMMTGSLIWKSLHKRPVSMKRSFSYSGRSFIWRHYRNHKAMIRLRNVY